VVSEEMSSESEKREESTDITDMDLSQPDLLLPDNIKAILSGSHTFSCSMMAPVPFSFLTYTVFITFSSCYVYCL
jgi:hypothetical protein